MQFFLRFFQIVSKMIKLILKIHPTNSIFADFCAIFVEFLVSSTIFLIFIKKSLKFV